MTSGTIEARPADATVDDADLLQSLQDFAATLDRLAHGLEPAAIHPRDASLVVERVVAVERRLATLRLLCSARAAETVGGSRTAHRSAEHWYAEQTGVGLPAARRALAAGRRLTELDRTRERAIAGTLSEAQIDRVAEAAVTDPGSESALLEAAATRGFRGLAEACDRVRASARSQEDEIARAAAAHRRRFLRSSRTVDGAFRLELQTTPDAGARVMAAVERRAGAIFDAARRQGRREPHHAYAADALVELATGTPAVTTTPGDTAPLPTAAPSPTVTPTVSGAPSAPRGRRAALADGTLVGPPRFGRALIDSRVPAAVPTIHDGPPTPPEPAPTAGRSGVPPGSTVTGPAGRWAGAPPGTSPPGSPLRVRASAPVPEPTAAITFVVDVEAFQRGRLLPGERCDLAGVGPVPLAMVERWIGQSRLNLVVTRGVDIASVTSLGRAIPTALRTALEVRDPTCVVPGCEVGAPLEIDHWRIPFAQGGPTELANLCRICPHHHDLKTYRGFTLTGGPGQWRFRPPDAPGSPPARPTGRPPSTGSRPRTPPSADPPTPAWTEPTFWG